MPTKWWSPHSTQEATRSFWAEQRHVRVKEMAPKSHQTVWPAPLRLAGEVTRPTCWKGLQSGEAGSAEAQSTMLIVGVLTPTASCGSSNSEDFHRVIPDTPSPPYDSLLFPRQTHSSSPDRTHDHSILWPWGSHLRPLDPRLLNVYQAQIAPNHTYMEKTRPEI